MDRCEVISKPLGKKQTRDCNVGLSIPVHPGVLQHSVGVRSARIAAVVTDQKVLYRDPAPELVSTNEEIEHSVEGDFVSTHSIDKLRVRPLDVKLDRLKNLLERRQLRLSAPNVFIGCKQIAFKIGEPI